MKTVLRICKNYMVFVMSNGIKFVEVPEENCKKRRELFSRLERRWPLKNVYKRNSSGL